MKASELAELLGCSVYTIEERARKCELPGLKFGDGGWIFPMDATLIVLNDMAMERMDEGIQVEKPIATLVGIATRRVRPTLPSI